jgi:hypothetical protein
MNGLLGATPADTVATWVAAAVTIVVLGGLLGERRAFGWTQHLLAGLLTGYLALLVLDEVIGRRLVGPLVSGGAARPELWLGIGLVALAAASPWLPRLAAAVPVSIAVGAIGAFALGGAVVGTILPQLTATAVVERSDAITTALALLGAVITILVLVTFVRGTDRGRPLATAVALGRPILLAGIGGWLGYLLLARLVLLSDRIGFIVGDWLGLR